MEIPDLEPKIKAKAEEYIYFEEFIRGTLDIKNYPNIIANQKDFARHVYRYAAIQGYDLESLITKFAELFGQDLANKAKGWKIESIKSFPPYDKYRLYFGLTKDIDLKFDFLEEGASTEQKKRDGVIDLAKELVEDQDLCIKYIRGFDEFVYWTGSYYKIDWGFADLGKLIYSKLEEKGLPERRKNVNEIMEYLRTFTLSETSQWDKDRNLLVFKNGIWNIKEQKFYPPNKEYLAFRVIEHEYHPVKEIPQVYREFLNNLKWNQYDQTRWLVALKSTIDHTAFDHKKQFIHFGVPNAGKTSIYHILANMLGESRVALISLERLRNQFTFANAESWFALIIDEIEVRNLDPIDYQKMKQISNNAALPVEKKGQDLRFVYPVFTTHQTMNGLYNFPMGAITDPICMRFILFKYTEKNKPDPVFILRMKQEAPNLMNYLLTANLPAVNEISPIPLTGCESDFDLTDPSIVMFYWDMETNRYSEFLKSLLHYKKGCYITVDTAVEEVMKICHRLNYRMDRLYFKKKILPELVMEVGGMMLSLSDGPEGRIFHLLKNIELGHGAKGHIYFPIPEFENPQGIIEKAKNMEDYLMVGGNDSNE